MVSYRGGLGDFVKVLDFGLVKSIQQKDGAQVTKAGEFFGTPGFVAPETVSGKYKIDARSDLYSLGATAYFLLTGAPVFDGSNSLDIFQKHAKETPVRPSEKAGRPIDADLEQLVMKCLENIPAKRPATARDLLASLSACQAASAWSQEMAAKWWNDMKPGQTEVVSDGDESSGMTFSLTTE